MSETRQSVFDFLKPRYVVIVSCMMEQWECETFLAGKAATPGWWKWDNVRWTSRENAEMIVRAIHAKGSETRYRITDVKVEEVYERD